MYKYIIGTYWLRNYTNLNNNNNNKSINLSESREIKFFKNVRKSEIRNIIATSVGWNEGVPRFLDTCSRWNSPFPVNPCTTGIGSSRQRAQYSASCVCVHAKERYWYKQGAGPVWSVLCNQAPITIEGGQSSSWTLAGTTLFQAIRLLARFCFKLFTTLDPWLRGMVERLLTLVSAARRHICLPVLGKSDKLMLIVMGKDR